MEQSRVKFATQVDPEILDKIRSMSKAEGRNIQNLIEEALEDYIERKTLDKPRRHVMDAYKNSHTQFKGLYKELAK